MIIVVATIETAPGRRADVLERLMSAVPLVHDETGCIDYTPAIDLESGVDGQDNVRENVITIVEKWESVEAFEKHLIAPHTNEFRTDVKDLLSSVALQIVEPA